MRMDLVQEASSENRVRTMCQLLFRLIDPSEAVRLLDECLTTKEKREVQSVLGQAFRLLIGQATGHYRLNMLESMDRDVLVRLLAVNKEERSWLARRYPGLDTSQHGNGHRFRNEKLDGSSIVITPKLLQSVRCNPGRLGTRWQHLVICSFMDAWGRVQGMCGRGGGRRLRVVRTSWFMCIPLVWWSYPTSWHCPSRSQSTACTNSIL